MAALSEYSSATPKTLLGLCEQCLGSGGKTGESGARNVREKLYVFTDWDLTSAQQKDLDDLFAQGGILPKWVIDTYNEMTPEGKLARSRQRLDKFLKTPIDMKRALQYDERTRRYARTDMRVYLMCMRL